MRLLITTDNFCSHYYNIAVESQHHMNNKPEFIYMIPKALNAIMMFQCTLESYINYMIYEHQKDKVKHADKKLIEHNFADKWRYFPILQVGNGFDENSQPFTDFKALVSIRNKMVHFKTKKMDFEITIPGAKTVSDVKEYLRKPGSLGNDLFTTILAVAITGRRITDDMIKTLHNLLGTEPPKFLDGGEEVLKTKVLSTE